MNCTDIDELAAELALGLVDGPARASALDHIDGCQRCRSLLDELAAAADELVLLAPRAEPSAGFEERVLARLRPVAIAHRRRRRVGVGLAGVAAAVVLVFAGFALGRVDRPADLVAAEMHTAKGRVVGEVYLRAGDPSWVFVAVPGWSDGPSAVRSETYRVRLTMADGRIELLPGGDLGGGNGAWGTVIDVDPSEVATVALVDEDGAAWCWADV